MGGPSSHTALFSRSYCPTALLTTALRHHCSNVELFPRAEIQLYWKDFIKNKQAIIIELFSLCSRLSNMLIIFWWFNPT